MSQKDSTGKTELVLHAVDSNLMPGSLNHQSQSLNIEPGTMPEKSGMVPECTLLPPHQQAKTVLTTLATNVDFQGT